MRHHPARIVLALVSFTLAAGSSVGCSSKEDEPTGMSIAKMCLETECDAIHRRSGEACSRCMNACMNASFSCDPSRSCAISCSSRGSTCSDDERTSCNAEGFRADLGERTSPEVEAACIRFFDHLDNCEVEIAGLDRTVCATWAKVERPEVAKLYDCAIARGCSGDSSESCSAPTTTLGDEVCDAMAATCGDTVCSPETRAALNENGGWLRDDVTAAAKACAAQSSCGDAQDCFRAWVEAARL